MDRKAFGRVEIKDADRGMVTAVFSTFDVVDRDGDVTVKGAIRDGVPVVISAYNHGSWAGALPVGKGVVRTDGKEARLEGQFFLNTQHGRDTFETVKALAEDGLGEWSYGFDVKDSAPGEHDGKSVRVLKELDVHEVSPVMLGAGVGTRTLDTKGLRFSEEGEAVMASLTSFTQRAADVMAKRAEKGKGLGDESGGLVKRVRDELGKLDALLAVEPTDEDGANEAQQLWLASIASDL
ncbi:HK97 family phage prohead protease [Streptomyces sp. 796.1]|uniref:HK97 family phage prohead protease n=1 Tax=Streptomyces sp. 796.1 TaxID=3163029 RepID=UPI0039C9821B